MKPLRQALLLAATAALLAGCLGGPAPVEHYLRIQQGAVAPCDDPGVERTADDVAVLALKPLESLPALDRLAVLLSEGQVLNPSTYWYWEGTPAEVLGTVLAESLSCSPRYRVVAPYRTRVAHRAVLTGSVDAFEIGRAPAPEFRLRVRLDLWSPHARQWLAGTTFSRTESMAALDPESAALAAEQAVAGLARDVIDWLERNRELLPEPEE
jgi:ABC-type uncharacterized transport system auxiliary subunit